MKKRKKNSRKFVFVATLLLLSSSILLNFSSYPYVEKILTVYNSFGYGGGGGGGGSIPADTISTYSNMSASPIDTASCKSPSNFTAKATTKNTVALAWEDPQCNDLSAIQIFKAEGNSLLPSQPNASVPKGTESYTDTDVSPGKTYKYTAKSIDNLGNISDKTSEVTVKILDYPITKILSLPVYTNSNAFDIGFEVNPDTPIKWVNLYYSSDGKNYNLYPGNFSLSPISVNLPDGNYKFYTIGISPIGTKEAVPETFDAQTIVDTSAPENVGISLISSNITNSLFAKVLFFGKDVSKMIVEGDISDNNINGKWIEFKETMTIPLTSGDGPKKITVKYKDSLGNISIKKSVDIVLDTSPPLMPEISVEETSFRNIKLNMSLNPDIYKVYIKGNILNNHNTFEWLPPEESYPLVLVGGEGEKTITVIAKDKAGNKSNPVKLKVSLQCPNVTAKKCVAGKSFSVSLGEDDNGCSMGVKCELCPPAEITCGEEETFVKGPVDENGCQMRGKCIPPACPIISYPSCEKGVSFMKDQGRDEKNCPLSPTCESCPEIIIPKCEADSVLLEQNNDENGCRVSPVCVETPKTCPSRITPPCTGGTLVSDGVDSDGCPLPLKCVLPTSSLTPSSGPQGGSSNSASVDSDNDNLKDYEEEFFTTNPENPDTDFDGILDGDEINKYHTNPLVKDSDRDSIPDGKEISVYFTDPLSRDTDGDTYTDIEEIQAKTDPLDQNSFPSDNDGDGVDDNWEKEYKEQLADKIKASAVYSLPEEEKKEGQTKLLKINTFGTRDTDSDGLSDKLEYKYGTNVFDKDTDKDGYLDGEEVLVYHSDPLSQKDPKSENLSTKITNWENGAVTGNTSPTFIGVAPFDSHIQIYAADKNEHKFIIAQGNSDVSGKFIIFTNTPLKDGNYNIQAVSVDKKKQINASPFIKITVDTSSSLPAPTIFTIGEKEIGKGSDIIIDMSRPSVIGNGYVGSTLVATFKSTLTTSMLYVDDPTGDFSITPAVDLEEGNHEVMLYTIFPDGIRSNEAMLSFSISKTLADISSGKNYNWIMWLILVNIVVCLIGWEIAMRSKEKKKRLQ